MDEGQSGASVRVENCPLLGGSKCTMLQLVARDLSAVERLSALQSLLLVSP